MRKKENLMLELENLENFRYSSSPFFLVLSTNRPPSPLSSFVEKAFISLQTHIEPE